MPFLFKSLYTYNELVKYFNSDEGKIRLSELHAHKIIIYPKGEKDADPTYIYSDVDLFPENESQSTIKLMFEALDQKRATPIFDNLSLYDLSGDVKYFGWNDFHGDPPILGNPN
jgi:hypothetical protein